MSSVELNADNREKIFNLNIMYQDVRGLKPHPRNAQTHSKKQIKQIADSINKFGFKNPIIVDDDNIKTMVDSFYNKVRTNDQLNFIFTDAIGADEQSWKPHLQKMYNFWSSVKLYI